LCSGELYYREPCEDTVDQTTFNNEDGLHGARIVGMWNYVGLSGISDAGRERQEPK
jgi:hypothetical protein